MKKVLILGAGMVVKPMVEYLIHHGYHVTVASRTKSKADMLVQGHPLGKSMSWTVDQEEVLDQLVQEHHLTVSLLPYAYHTLVAGFCLRHQRPMVTTSYVQKAMADLDSQAKEKGILLLNEIGVDPGIDHMSAMKIIDHVHDKGGKVHSFFSITGALPAPEATDNPFRYKFSWSPKGVVMAGNNDGRYILKGSKKYVPTENLFKTTFRVDFPEIGQLEVYPNRDSVQYRDIYEIPEVQTLFRGTFRYPNWCQIMDAMKALKLISYEKLNLSDLSYAGMVRKLNNIGTEENLEDAVRKNLKPEDQDIVLEALAWLGLLSDESINRKEDSPFEVVSDLMIKKMMLGEKERDMIVMQHSFLAEYPDGNREVIHSRMLDFGSPHTNTAVARTVALPAAIAVRLILEGKINLTGVFRPVVPEIYNPVLQELEHLGIKLTEEFGRPESDLPAF